MHAYQTLIDNILELIDKCVGSRIWVVMKGDKGNRLSKKKKRKPHMSKEPPLS